MIIGLKQRQIQTRTKVVTNGTPIAIHKNFKPPLPLPALENEEESVDLQGQGMKFIILSIFFDILTRLEGLLGLKLSDYTDNLTGASNIIDEIFKGAEIRNAQHYQNVLDNFYTK